MATNTKRQAAPESRAAAADPSRNSQNPLGTTAPRLTPEITTITLAVGESMRVPLKEFSDEEASKLYWSTSEREHVYVDRSGLITAVAPGEATITVKPEQGSRSAAKIKVYVISDALYYSSYAARMLPIAISDHIREVLRVDFNIIDNESFIRKYKDAAGRRALVSGLGESDVNVRRMFRETLLAAVPGMTTSFGFYAALAGVRNVYDLARVSIFKIVSVIGVFCRTVRVPEGVTLDTPTQVEIAAIIGNAGRMIGTMNENYYLVMDNDPEPAYLFDRSHYFRSDGDVLSESINFMQSIEVNLPLPRTISGTVKMKERDLTGKMVENPKPGYYVQISGISSPAQDKVEDEEDLCAYTDGDGRFSIVMPDRYNLQETVKITIFEKNGDGFGIVQSRTVADTLPRMVFVRRASEVLESENIRIKKVFKEKDKDGKTVRRTQEVQLTWAELREMYSSIVELRKKNFSLERKIRIKIAAHGQMGRNSEEIRIRRRRLMNKYEFIREQLLRYLKKHTEVYETREEEEYRIKIGIYLEVLRETAVSVRQTLAEWEQRMRSYRELNGDRTDGEDGDGILYETIANELAAAQERFDKLNEVLDELDAGNISTLDVLYEDQYFANYLAEAKNRISEKLESIRMENEDQRLTSQHIQDIRQDIAELEGVINNIKKDLSDAQPGDADDDEIDKPDMYGLSLSEISDSLLGHSDEVAEQIRQELMLLLAEQDQISLEIEELEVIDSFKEYIETQTGDADVIEYTGNKAKIKEYLEYLCGDAYDEANLDLAIKQLFSRSLDADLGDFILIREMFEGASLKPRALPSVRLMGEGDTAVYLPTDTAPSRIFNYSMVQRLIEPAFSVDGGKTEGTRNKLSDMLDVSNFRELFYTDPDKVPVAISLGMGYILNMHQAWVPDGYALGNLLYSLVLAPGEEQRIVVREHTESYSVNDEASALDTIRDTYSNRQTDNESAAFHNAADRFSSAYSKYDYHSSASSSGGTGIGIFFGIGVGSTSSSSNRGGGSSSASQGDNYSEVSQAAQSFQTEIKTESERISAAQRASIRIASSSESESVASRIIANHNHSHVMTIQYWEVMRRYRMETCIEGVELVLFVPMKPVRFLPVMTDAWKTEIENEIVNNPMNSSRINAKEAFGKYELQTDKVYELGMRSFAFRYSQILRHADVLASALPLKYRGGLNLVKKYAAYSEWKMEKRTGEENQVIKLTLTGCFLEFDNIVATLHFAHSDVTVVGIVTARDCFRPDPSLNTRADLIYGLKKLREGTSVKRVQDRIKKYITLWWYDGTTKKFEMKSHTTTEGEEQNTLSPAVWEISFTLPSYIPAEDIAFIRVENQISGWEQRLSQDFAYLEDYEKSAINRYEGKMNDYYKDNDSSEYDAGEIERMKTGLPECYTSPIASFSASELRSCGALELHAEVKWGTKPVNSLPEIIRLQYQAVDIDVSEHVPILRYNEIMKIEEMFHHVLSYNMRYSQAVWASLSDDERIMMLEPYTVDMNYDLWYDSSESGRADVEDSRIPLLNCVNAKRVIGFYGNCMLLPFTYPQRLADILGKTAADVQEELYRFHTTSFRVPSTVISVPTDGMVGEAVLGATNVSEKVDITRYWNWKDSDIDHIELNQNALGGRSLLENASTMRVDAPTQGVTTTAHIDSSGLAQALASRAQPTFADVLANTDIRDLIKNADNNASKGRESIVEANSAVLKSAIEAASSIGSAALTGGASGIAKALGDKDVLKSALGEIGMSEESAGKLVDKISSGKASYSDFAQGIANAVKKQGKGEPGKDDGVGGDKDPDPGGSGKPGENRKPGGSEQSGAGGSVTGAEPSGGTEPDGSKNPSNETPAKTEEPGKSNEALKSKCKNLLEAVDNGIAPIDYFNAEVKRITGEDCDFDNEEVIAMFRDYCHDRGADYDEIMELVDNEISRKLKGYSDV